MIEWFKARRRLWLVLGGILVVGSLGVWLWDRISAPDVTSGKVARTGRAGTPVDKTEVELTADQLKSIAIAPAGQSDFNNIRPALGNIDFNQNMLVQVFTPYQGRIIAAFVNVGDRVERGQVLFTVDSPDLLQASSTLIAAAGTLVLQNRNLKRVTETFKGGGGAQKDVDQATADQQAAEGAFKAARDAMRLVGKSDEEVDRIISERKADSALLVRSPILGFVTARTAAPGLLVQPGSAPAPVTLADTATMWMIANVVEADSGLLRVGQQVAARVNAFPDRIFSGSIVVVGASVDPQTRRVLVRSEIADPDRLLRAGMFAGFDIRISDPIRALAVPTTAVVREGDGTMTLWVTADRRRFERRPVRIGLQQGGFTQILEGVQPGELVVTDGAIFLSNKLAGGPSD
jgi:cobalt-zinc-cadmium efflux system membrane fusion protein